jgi:hypothetical protein
LRQRAARCGRLDRRARRPGARCALARW